MDEITTTHSMGLTEAVWLQKLLLARESTRFCGYNQEHPTHKKVTMYLVSSDEASMGDALRTAIRQIHTFRNAKQHLVNRGS